MGKLPFIPTLREHGPAAVATLTLLLGLGCQGPSTPQLSSQRRAISGGAYYVPDCNDPDNAEAACTRPTDAIIAQLKAEGYPYYIGHAEPTTEFFSRSGMSGSNMQWKFSLPATDPSPAQDGSSVANFELFAALWMGLDLCDPNSIPGGACTAVSDANNPATAGAAFLELQFYPPGSPFALGTTCSNTQWCASLHINTLENFTAFQHSNCVEPTTAAFITLDGTPAGSQLLMNNGDSIQVTIKDTPSGLETDVSDLTAGTSGSMVASGANGFVHNKNQTDCSTEAFDFHPMYATAAPGQVVPWATLSPNVAYDFEIGHFELCSDSTCSTKPDGAGGEQQNCGTLRGIGGCIDSDTDHDGVPYTESWADGTAAHPASTIIGSPDDSGVGPLTALAGSPATYNEGYGTIKFATTEGTNGAFYPYFAQHGTGAACRFEFGNTNKVAGTATNDFGKAAQYGTTIDNPCAPGKLATSLSYTGQTAQDFDDVATLSASLTNTDTGNGISSVTVSFTLGSQSCSGVTDGTGTASCTITLSQAPGGYTVQASFAGNAQFLASSASTGFTITKEEDSLHYTGATAGDFHDAATVSAVLTEDGITPLAGKSVSFTLNGSETCSAVTDATGSATCTITPGEAAGGYPLVVNFAGDADYVPSSSIVSFTVTKEETTLTSTSALQVIATGSPATFSATLTEDGTAPIAGRTVTITLGSGGSAQSCNGVTNASGVATCSIIPAATLSGPQPVTDGFAGDAFYLPATNAQSALLFSFLANGAFVVGDKSAVAGATVTWWGAQWSKSNVLSGGAAPDAFKGFAISTVEPPACGAGWSTDPGNSAPPPPATSIPSYMGVIVAAHASKSGAAIKGDTPKIVVVKTNPGYAPDPSHAGTGTVAATFCP